MEQRITGQKNFSQKCMSIYILGYIINSFNGDLTATIQLYQSFEISITNLIIKYILGILSTFWIHYYISLEIIPWKKMIWHKSVY